jgi:hypothetical protein
MTPTEREALLFLLRYAAQLGGMTVRLGQLTRAIEQGVELADAAPPPREPEEIWSRDAAAGKPSHRA